MRTGCRTVGVRPPSGAAAPEPSQSEPRPKPSSASHTASRSVSQSSLPLSEGSPKCTQNPRGFPGCRCPNQTSKHYLNYF